MHRIDVKEQRGLEEETGPGHPPARPQKGRVQEVWPVGGSNHKHVLRAVEPIQLSQELRHHPVGRRPYSARESSSVASARQDFSLKAASARSPAAPRPSPHKQPPPQSSTPKSFLASLPPVPNQKGRKLYLRTVT